MKILLVVICCLLGGVGVAQNKDSIAIVKQTTKYIQGFYQEKPSWLEEVLHPELVKRTLRAFPNSDQYIASGGQSEMVQLCKIFNKNGKYSESSKAQIKVLDVFKEMATVKLTAETWVDYIHLVKVNGKWQIINVIWLMI